MFFRFFFFILPVALGLTLPLTVIRPLRLRRPYAAALEALFLVFLLKFLWFRLFGGCAFRPELPLVALRIMGWSYAFAMILGLLALLPPWRRRQRRHALALLAVAASVAAWGLWEGVRVPSVETREVTLPGLPPAFDGFRIVHLSDLHASPATARAHFEGIVARANACSPDLVCITGDFADGSPEARDGQLAPLARLRAKHGVVGCSGNHEFYSDYSAWHPVLESYGIRLLDNAAVVVTNGLATLAVGGVLDPAGRRHGVSPWTVGPDVAAAFAGMPDGAFRILLKHVPFRERDPLQASRIGLQLSGHTHGGAVLGFDLLVRCFNEGHVRGLYEDGPYPLYVSPGTGQWAGFPMRLGVPARITLLVLRRARRRDVREAVEPRNPKAKR